MATTLVVMAAGMGSRFGGLKQAQSITSDGKALVDFSVFDARRVGFDKFVFIIRHDMESDFRELVGKRLEKNVDVEYVFQTIDCLPQGREKPFGTGHAVLCCKDVVKSPFAVVNADDYYGKHAFDGVYAHLTSAQNGNYAMTAYMLGQTVSVNGTVTRGVCDIRDGMLRGVTECYEITDKLVGNLLGKTVQLRADTPVSMNLWGLTTDIFERLGDKFDVFKSKADLLKDEFLLPTVINELVTDGQATVRAYTNADKWYGITYKQDLPDVQKAIGELVTNGEYEGIW